MGGVYIPPFITIGSGAQLVIVLKWLLVVVFKH